MRHPARVLLGSAVILLCGCSGGIPLGGSSSIPPVTSPSSSPAPQPQPLDISGNWQFNTTSTTGKPPASIGGSIVESGGAVTSRMHANDPACFGQLETIDWTGTLSGSDISLTSAPVEGEVATLTGTVTNDGVHETLSGTYAINGGCRDGDSGSVTGILLYIDDALDGTFTSSSGQMFSVSSGGIAQNGITPNADGTFGLTGTATFTTSCLTQATIPAGSLASGSFIMGDTVGIEFDTSNGTITFAGTLDLSSYDPEFDSYQIKGSYKVSGGTCEDTGTATLREYNPWDY